MRYWEKLAELQKKYPPKRQVRAAFLRVSPNTVFTGAGYNGQIEPSKAVGLAPNGTVIHEGELVINRPYGDVVLPYSPARSEQEQERLTQEQRMLNLPGMQTGGIIPRQQQQPINIQTPNTSVQQPIINQPVNTNANKQQSINVQVPNTSIQQPVVKQNSNQQFGLLQPTQNQQQQQSGFNLQGSLLGQSFKPLYEKSINTMAQTVMPTLQGLATGQNSIYDKMTNKYMGELGATQAAENQAVMQQYAQQGLTPESQVALQGLLKRQQEMAKGQMAEGLAEKEAAQMINANQALQGAAGHLQIQAQQLEQFDEAKTKEAINNLIKAGGEANIKKAEELASKLYNYDDFSFGDELVKQKMNALGKYAAMGLGVEDAIKLAKQNGDLDKYGITEEQAKDMLAPLVLAKDPVYAANQHYKSLLKQGLIDEDTYDKITKAVKFLVTTPQGVEITDSFKVYDNNGNEIGNFKSQQEAIQFAQQNGLGQDSVKYVKNGWIGFKGDYVPLVAKGVKNWDIYEDNGNLYMMVDGKPVDLVTAWGAVNQDPFSIQGQKILTYLETHPDAKEKHKELYKTIMNKVAQLANDDPALINDESLIPGTPVYETLKNIVPEAKFNRSKAKIGGNRVWKIDSLEGLPENGLVKIGNGLYRLVSKSTKNAIGRDSRIYIIRDVVNGDEYTINAGEPQGELENTLKAITKAGEASGLQ